MRRGFTLIELMIVVAIIGILAAIAVPKFADLIIKSREGATKGNLGRIRSALNIYYADLEGYYPSSGLAFNVIGSNVLSANLVPRYIDRIPKAHLRNHPQSNSVYSHAFSQVTHNHDVGYGYWGYDGIYPPNSNAGAVWLWCSHTDAKGTKWTAY